MVVLKRIAVNILAGYSLHSYANSLWKHDIFKTIVAQGWPISRSELAPSKLED